MTQLPRPGAAITAGLLALLALATFVARLPCAQRLLPHTQEPDAYLVQLAQDWRGDPARIERIEYAERYPVLLPRLLALLPWPDAADDARTAGGDPQPLEWLLGGAAAPYQAGRYLVLCLSLLAIPGTWLVARRLAGARAAWIAAALVATSFLHALFSTQARPHGPQAAFAVLAAWAAMRYVERAVVARAALAVLLSALSLSTLQIGAGTLPPLCLAGWLAGGGTILRRLGRAALLPFLAVAASLWAYPFALRFDEGGLRLGGKGAHEIAWSRVDFGGLAEVVGFLASHDPLLLVLAGGALASWAVRWRASARALASGGDVAIACAYALPYAAVLASVGEVLDRWTLPLLPWIATLGGWILVRLAGTRPILPVLAVAALALPAAVVGRYAWICARPDSNELAARWIVAQPDATSATIVGSPGLVVPLAYEAAALRADVEDSVGQSSIWTQYQDALEDGALSEPRVRYHMTPGRLAQWPQEGLRAWFEATRPEIVLLERTRKNWFLSGGRELSALAVERGRLVHRTSGTPESESIGLLHYQSLEAPIRRLFASERLGAPIEIWRLSW